MSYRQGRKYIRKFYVALGTSFSIEEAIAFVEKRRRRRIVIVHKLLHMAYPGLCLSLKDVDVIFLMPNIEKIGKDLYLVTLLHELVHVYLGHPERLEIDFATFEQIEGYIPSVRKDFIHKRSSREDIAETTATLLVECVKRNDEEIPSRAKRLYNY
jgi:hypothetical protein